MSDDTDPIPPIVRASADGLWRRMNERLDDVLAELRKDMLARTPADDSIAWLFNKKFFEEQITEAFAKDLLVTALYRLARYEADHR